MSIFLKINNMLSDREREIATGIETARATVQKFMRDSRIPLKSRKSVGMCLVKLHGKEDSVSLLYRYNSILEEVDLHKAA